MNKINVGDVVKPVTPAGLELSDVPCDGEYERKYNVSCIFKGFGKVIEIKDIVIDYTTWPEDYNFIGKMPYRCCKVECDSGIGWAGEGAISKYIKTTEEVLKMLDYLAHCDRTNGFRDDLKEKFIYYMTNYVRNESSYANMVFQDVFKVYTKKGLVGVYQEFISDEEICKAIAYSFNLT